MCQRQPDSVAIGTIAATLIERLKFSVDIQQICGDAVAEIVE